MGTTEDANTKTPPHRRTKATRAKNAVLYKKQKNKSLLETEGCKIGVVDFWYNTTNSTTVRSFPQKDLFFGTLPVFLHKTTRNAATVPKNHLFCGKTKKAVLYPKHPKKNLLLSYLHGLEAGGCKKLVSCVSLVQYSFFVFSTKRLFFGYHSAFLPENSTKRWSKHHRN